MRPNRPDPSSSSGIPSAELIGVGELGGRADGAVADISLTTGGVTIAPRGAGRPVVPTLITWSHLRGFSADATLTLEDGTTAQVLEIVSHGTSGDDHTESRKFVVPVVELVVFFRAVGERSAEWAAGLQADGAAPAGIIRRRVTELALVVAGVAALIDAAVQRKLSDWGLVSAARHGRGGRPVAPVAAVLLVVAVIAGGATASLGATAAPAAPHHRSPFVAAPVIGNDVQATAAPGTSDLPAATAAPEPAPPALASSAPLQSHEIFGYAPYWTLPESSGFDVQDLTTLAYFSVDANGDGSLDQSGPGWNGYESQDLTNLVTRSHAAGDRVVLTVTCFSQASLNQITSDPTAAATLSSALIAAVSAKNLDGVNFDFEGEGSADRTGLTALLTQVSNALHAANPHWQVTMATYASAAADSSGFYDVAALAPALDGFFVMAYDMNDPVNPSPTAPLMGGGYNDTETLQQFTAVVPASKVILGVPYYGYDWPTTDGTPTAQSTGPESPLSYGTIAAAGNPTYWDAATDTAWTSYQVGAQWHETYFDNPTSLALKASLANSFHIRGMGIWALGMDGNDPAMLAALLGNAPPVKDYTPGPTATSPSPTTAPGIAGAGFTSTGQFEGQAEALAPVAPVTTGGTYVGLLTGFQTTDPQLSCLQSGPPLDVWALPGSPGTYEVLAVQPGDCAEAAWTFAVPAPPPTTTTVPPTTTTAPPTTTTTTTTVPPTTTTTTTVGGHGATGSSTPATPRARADG
jgi:hypothetical protein